MSDENYARAERSVAERIVRDHGGADVHVITSARRLDRLLPSYWQERVKMGHNGSWETWLQAILGDEAVVAGVSPTFVVGEGEPLVWQAIDTVSGGVVGVRCQVQDCGGTSLVAVRVLDIRIAATRSE